MSNIIEFTGEYYTRQKRSQEFVDSIALNYVEYMEAEGFDINNLKPSKNLDDGFKKLHKAIHELEGFISTKNKTLKK